jgi:RNA polymerase sigma-70 factor (ECF subfamily)
MSGAGTTRWSLILAARGDSASAREALAQLCEAYRPVVLAYFRRQLPPERVDDITQSFFLHFLEKQLAARADAARGSFRAFLFAAARNHWRETRRNDSAAKRGAATTVAEPAIDAFVDARLEPAQACDRDWAIQVLHRARERLGREAERSGKSALFAAVRGFLVEPPDASDYARVGARLGMAANTVAVAVRRLRERLRALVRRELADTLPPGADIDAEMRWLKQALQGDA